MKLTKNCIKCSLQLICIGEGVGSNTFATGEIYRCVDCKRFYAELYYQDEESLHCIATEVHAECGKHKGTTVVKNGSCALCSPKGWKKEIPDVEGKVL